MLLGVEADGAHERQRLGDAISQLLIAMGLGRILHEAQHPAVSVLKIGIAAGGERAQKVQRRRRLAITFQQPPRIRRARLGCEVDIVDDVALIARQLNVAALFRRRGARLGELAGDAAHLHYGRGAGKRQHHGHLEENAEKIADVVGGMLGEALRAVTALKQERLSGRHFTQSALQFARLAREHERGKAGQRFLGVGQRRRIGIGGRLLDGLGSPAVRGPTFCRHARCSRAPNARCYEKR